MKKRLIKALYYIPDGQCISLGNDTFLTGLLDGSDKIYGFGREGNNYIVIANGYTYSIDDLTKDDLRYIFAGSSIYAKIKSFDYMIYDIDMI
jgi:hypothetical protein